MLQTPYERTGDFTSVENGDNFLHDLADQTTAVVNTIGEGILGDPLYSITVGTGAARVAVLGAVHGNERGPREAAYAFIRDMAYQATPTAEQLANEVAWTFIPTANPSGVRNYTRTPLPDSADINRDYINRELPESLAIASWLLEHQPALILDLHEHPAINFDVNLATGRQVHPGISAGLRDLSTSLTDTIGQRAIAEGYTWSRYTDSQTGGTARTESGRIYKASYVLFEADRTIAYQDRVDVTLHGLDEAALFWMEYSQEFEDAHEFALNPPPSGLYRTTGEPVALPGVRLYYADGTPFG